MILKAEKPFNFVALALILKEIHNNKDYIVKQPIFLDATCSGIQHIAGLIRDFDLASKTNLTPASNLDKPNDFYNNVVSLANKTINDCGEAEGKDNLAYVKLNRKILKTSIMTKTYNVTAYGMKEQIKQNLKLKNEDDKIEDDIENILRENFKFRQGIYLAPSKLDNEKHVELNEFDIIKIARILNEVIFIEYPTLGEVYNFFIRLAKLTNILNIPLS
jgi:DNA-directed RNA polymerase